MDYANANKGPLTFSDRIPRKIFIKLDQTTTFRRNLFPPSTTGMFKIHSFSTGKLSHHNM
ncbi:unnamed protein product, partial [Nesidiocoris tenuis]